MSSDRKARVGAEEAKARLIAATIELLKEVSVLEITTRLIGERAGLDRRAITRQFGGEVELFIATLEELQIRSTKLAKDVAGTTHNYVIEEWEIRTKLWAFLILSEVDPERLRAIRTSEESKETALGVIGLDLDAPAEIQETFIALLQAVSLAGNFFGPSSPRSTPENRFRIFLLLRHLASLGPELPKIVGLSEDG